VADIYAKYTKLAGDSGALDFGVGHIVWSDENWDRSSIEWCIKQPDESDYWTPEQHALAVESLKELLAVPDEIRECEPADYDGEHPENYPPPAGLVMVTK